MRIAGDTRLRAGTVFAQDFRVLGPLDEGGMGLVYRVEQLSTGEERALKVLKPDLLRDGRSHDRFAQEATVGSHIASDHIVKVISAGVDDATGVPWIAMELLRGETLRELLRERGALSASEALEVCRQLCHALAAAHAAGVVHRDLKPENIFVADARSPGRAFVVKLLDFGLAKVLLEFETAVTPTTVVGSPLWMAPEQVRRDRIRPATDVWALGLLVFWMLTGRFYWRAAYGESPNPEAVLHEKLYEPMVPASRRAAELARGVTLPRGFDEWFRRCTARDPGDRFRNATDAFAGLLPVLEHPGGAGLRGERGALLAGGALAIALFGAGLYAASRAMHTHAGVFPAAATGSAATGATGGRGASGDAGVSAASAASAASVDAGASGRGATSGSRAARRWMASARPVAMAMVSSGRAGEELPPHLPSAAGYIASARPELDGTCNARGFAHAWRAEPVWFQTALSTVESLERSARLEGQMAQSASTGAARAQIAAQAERSQSRLAEAQAAFARQSEAGLAQERARVDSAAREAGCRPVGLQVEARVLFHRWCCPP